MEKALLAGPIMSELGWETLRFAPHILWKKKRLKIKLIVFTRPDRFDLYGQVADILIPLKIEGDFTTYKGNCWRLDHYPIDKYYHIANKLYNKYSKRFKIVEHIYPNIRKNQFLNKIQFPLPQMIHEFHPREENLQIVNKYIPSNKPIVILAPRFRKGMRRNWPHWEQFYDTIYNSKLMKNFTFVICGKNPECFSDPKSRFLDINKFSLTSNSSLIGVTIEVIKKSVLVCGSQSAIPNLAMTLQTKSIQWGNQMKQHTKQYNVKNTPVIYHQDNKFRISSNIIFTSLKNELAKEGRK